LELHGLYELANQGPQIRHDQAILRFEGNIELLGCKAKPNRSKVALDQDYDSPKS